MANWLVDWFLLWSMSRCPTESFFFCWCHLLKRLVNMPYNKPATARTTRTVSVSLFACKVAGLDELPELPCMAVGQKPKSNNILAFVIGFSSWQQQQQRQQIVGNFSLFVFCSILLCAICTALAGHSPQGLGLFNLPQPRRHLFVCIHKILYS